MTLLEVKLDTKVKITEVLSGRRLRNHLLALGLFSGSIIRVTGGSHRSPVTIKVKDSTFTIGHGMASKILVEVV